MTDLVVTGFASLDYPVRLAGSAAGDTTTLITDRDPKSWPRLGGCPAYVASEVARSGLSAAPVTWVGTDREGDAYRAALRDKGCDDAGVARLQAARSPVALLAYQADGACVCLYDPALGGREQLTAPQRDLIAAARAVCITVGPPQVISEVLALRKEATPLFWVLKNDPACFPDDVCATLSASASVIFCSRAERQMIGETRETAIIVETDGTKGVTVYRQGRQDACAVEPVDVFDTTGAGDTLAGGFIAAVLQGETDPLRATRRGITAVHRLLSDRAEQERTPA